MLNKEIFDYMKGGLRTFKQIFPLKYTDIKNSFDIWVLLLSIAKKESAFNPFVENPGNKDYGLFQFIPSTLDSTIKLYQTKPEEIQKIKNNFYSKDLKTAVTSQTFVMLHLVAAYAKNIQTKEPVGYYKDFLKTITDKDLKNIAIAYLQHGGGYAIYKGYVTSTYEMISTLVLDILHNAKSMYKMLYGTDKEIKFDLSKFETNAIEKGILVQVQAAYDNQKGV